MTCRNSQSGKKITTTTKNEKEHFEVNTTMGDMSCELYSVSHQFQCPLFSYFLPFVNHIFRLCTHCVKSVDVDVVLKLSSICFRLNRLSTFGWFCCCWYYWNSRHDFNLFHCCLEFSKYPIFMWYILAPLSFTSINQIWPSTQSVCFYLYPYCVCVCVFKSPLVSWSYNNCVSDLFISYTALELDIKIYTKLYDSIL